MSKKRIALLMAVVMVLGVAVGSTMAWLTDKTGDVVNTFTVGDINIDLKEHTYISETDAATDPTLAQQVGTLGTTEVASNDDYLFVPGDTLPKDPFVTVEAGSEKCYLFVKVTEAYNDCEVTVDGEDKSVNEIIHWDVEPKIVGQDTADNNWTRYTVAGAENSTEYWYTIVEKSEAAQSWYILKNNQITVDTGVIKEMVTDINTEGQKPQIIVTAAAVQYDNLVADDATADARLAAAWENLPAEFKPAP